jgi:hypothetical protein
MKRGTLSSPLEVGASSATCQELGRRVLGQVFIQALAGTQALLTPRTENRIDQFPTALATVIEVRHNVSRSRCPSSRRRPGAKAKSLGN